MWPSSRWWRLWFPLLPISLLLLGRVWCAVCPLAAAASLVQRLRPATRRVPSWLRRSGVWLMGLTFLTLTWADRIWGITASPRATGLVLLLLLAGAAAVSLLYERRVWCRYLCPIGALTGLYAMAAVTELRAQPAHCRSCQRKDCYNGSERGPGCPLLEFPATLSSNRNCNLCASCVKTCPHDSFRLRLRAPGKDLWQVAQPLLGESLLAVLLVAVVYVQTIDMTFAWGEYMKRVLESGLLASYSLVFTLTLLAVVLVAVGLYLLAGWLSSRLGAEEFGANVGRFGYAYLALALAGHLSHNLSHLIGEGPRAVATVLSQLGLPWLLAAMAEPQETTVMAADPLALAIVGVGGAFSLFAAWRIAGRGPSNWRAALPHLILILVFFALYTQMFLLPMNPRHTH